MNQFKGTGRLIRLALRRDRIKLTIAVLATGVLMPLFVAGISGIFSSDEEMRQGIAFLAANPAMRLFGLPTGGEFGHLLMLRTYTMLAIIISLISTFTVIRHTRQNEEWGRFELVASTSVGRYAGLAAALVVALAANIIMTGFIFAGLLTGDLPVSGALLMALSIGSVGIFFSGVASVCAQLTRTSRGANGLAAIGVAVSFLLSGIGSVLGRLEPSGVVVVPAWPSWVTPFGWGQLTQPFADENWWIFFIFAIFWGISVILALVLLNMRDVGLGIISARAGRGAAKAGLLSVSGLAWRLNRGVFSGWLIGVMILGVIYGIIASDVEDLLGQAEGIAQLFIANTGSEEIILAFFGSIVSMLGIFVLAYAVQVALRLRSEETRALDFVLAANVSRFRWIMVQIGFILITVTIMLVLAGLSAGLTAEVTWGDTEGVVWPVVAGMLVQLPAICLLVGLVVAIFGLLPRYAGGIAWAAVTISIVFGPFFGSMLNLPEKILNISPLTHTPIVPPTENVEVWPIVILSGIAFFLLVTGVLAFRYRSLGD